MEANINVKVVKPAVNADVKALNKAVAIGGLVIAVVLAVDFYNFGSLKDVALWSIIAIFVLASAAGFVIEKLV